MSENKKKFEIDLALKQDELSSVMKNMDDDAEKITKIKDLIDVDEEKLYNFKIESSTLQANYDSNLAQINEKAKILDKNVSAKDSILIQKEEISLDYNKKNNTLIDLLNNEENLKAQNVILQQKQEEILKNENALKQEIITLKSKYNYLCNLENENEGYFKSVKEALDFSKNHGIENVYGTVASLISTDEIYEYAIEIALGGYLQNIVVEDETIAKEIISYLKQNLLGRVTFLPLSTIRKNDFNIKDKVKKFDGFIGMASDIVRFDTKFKDIVNLTLGTTIVVNDIESATEISRKIKNMARIVTLSGELFATTGSITGGKNSHSSAGLLGRKEKIERLNLEISSKNKAFEQFKKDTEYNFTKLTLGEAELAQTLDQKSKLQIEVATLKEKLNYIVKEEEKISLSKESTKDSIDTLNKTNAEIAKSLKAISDEIALLEEKIAKNQEVINEYSRFNKEKSNMINDLHEDIANLKISISSFDESSSSIDEMKEKLLLDIQNFEEAVDRKKLNIKGFDENIKSMQDEIKLLKDQIKEKQNFKLDFANLLNNLKDNKKEIDLKLDESEKKLLDITKKIDKLKDERAKVQSKKLKYDIEIENLKNKMWDEYELTISSAKDIISSMPLDTRSEKDILKDAEKIRKEIKELGEVSVSAIEEYKSTKERFDFISNQKEDLEQTKKKLENLINNMTSTMKQQFEKQFRLINENFNETFKELFGGGKAELRLEDESNILTSGIEIDVQPPGKKLQSMMLLSGGERALTATALLFAILKLKAPPFCILDEIEAALDDVNVHRFAEYIKKYSKNTQFIVITHRKGTMEVASSTYGVTMQEYGVSKVVSMKMK